MRRLRFALAAVALALASSAGTASASSQCPSAFWSPSTGTCGMTGRTQGGCICEYICEFTEQPEQWFNFC